MTNPISNVKVPALETGYNLDTLRDTGVFSVVSPVSGPSSGTEFYVFAYSANVQGSRKVLQSAHDLADGTEYFRTKGVNGWSTWTARGTGGGGGGLTVAEIITGLNTDLGTFGWQNPDRVYNVLDYGAVRGTTDGAANRAAFEDAIIACAAAGGGIIYAPAGTYYINYGGAASVGGIRLRDNMTLQGDGMGTTIIKCADIVNNDLAGVVRTQSGVQNHNIVIRDLTIDGNKGEQTGWANIICFFAGVTPNVRDEMDSDIFCINVECKNGKNGTAGSANLTRGYGFDPHEVVDRFVAINCYAHDCERDGFVLDGVTNFQLIGNRSNNNGRYGFNIITECFNGIISANSADGNGSNNYMVQGDSHHIKIDGNFSFNAGEQGIRVRRGLTVIDTFVTITNNHVEGSMRNGINLTGCAFNTVQDNLIIDSSQQTNNTYMQVSLDEDDGDSLSFTGASDNYIKGNRAIAKAGTANKAKAGYREDLTGAVPARNTYLFNASEGHVQGKYLTLSPTARLIDSTPAWYNVKDYGAKADGVTSDTTVIRAVVDIVSTAGGGVVYCPAGTYALSGTGTSSQGCIALPSNVTLLGDGPGKTVFKLLDQVNVAVTGVVRLLSGAANTNVQMIGFTVDGNKVAQTGTGDHTGIYTGGTGDADILVADVEVKNCQNGVGNLGHGLRLKDVGTRFKLINVYSHDNERDGINVDTVTKVFAQGVRADSNGRNGFDFTGCSDVEALGCVGEGNLNNFVIEGDAFDVRLVGGKCAGSTNEGFRIKAGATVVDTRVAITGMEFSGNARDGLKIGGGQNNLVTACVFRDNGQAANNTYPDISLLKDTTNTTPLADRNVISGNIFYALAANKTKYGISETATEASNNKFLWNTFSGHTTADINLLGAGTTRFDSTNAASAEYLALSVAPGVATAGFVKTTAFARGGSLLPAYIDPTGKFRAMGSHIGHQVRGEFIGGNGSSTTAVGFPTTGGGTAASASYSTVTKAQSTKRTNFASGAAINNDAGLRQSSLSLVRGNGNSIGGMYVTILFSIGAFDANTKGFFGVFGANTFVPNGANPSAAVDVFGVGFDPGQTTLRLINNDATGAATTTDLGANFPVQANKLYELVIFCEPNAGGLSYVLTDVESTYGGALHQASGTVTTDIPANNKFLGVQGALNTGAGTAAISLDLAHVYFEAGNVFTLGNI